MNIKDWENQTPVLEELKVVLNILADGFASLDVNDMV